MLLRRQLFIAVWVLAGGGGTAFAAGNGQSGMLVEASELIDFGRSGFIGDSFNDTAKLAGQHRFADVRQEAHVAYQNRWAFSGDNAMQQATASEPMAGSMYVLGFSLIGFAVVARRRSNPAPGCE